MEGSRHREQGRWSRGSGPVSLLPAHRRRDRPRRRRPAGPL